MHHKIFRFVMSYLAMSLGDRFCVNRKGETGEVVGASEECEQHGWSGLARKKV